MNLMKHISIIFLLSGSLANAQVPDLIDANGAVKWKKLSDGGLLIRNPQEMNVGKMNEQISFVICDWQAPGQIGECTIKADLPKGCEWVGETIAVPKATKKTSNLDFSYYKTIQAKGLQYMPPQPGDVGEELSTSPPSIGFVHCIQGRNPVCQLKNTPPNFVKCENTLAAMEARKIAEFRKARATGKVKSSGGNGKSAKKSGGT